MSGETSRFPLCRACNDMCENAARGAPAMEEIPLLSTPAELDSFPNLTRKTFELHVAFVGGVLAQYQFDADVRCSLPGEHLHQKGVVVRMLCGLVLCMGVDCGRKHVDGFAQIERHVKNVNLAASELRLLSTQPANWIDVLRASEREVQRLEDIRSRIRNSFPLVYGAIAERTKRGGGTRSEFVQQYTYNDADGNRKYGEQVVQLQGLAFFDPKMNAKRCTKLIADARDLEAEAGGADLVKASGLARRRRRIDDGVREYLEWVEAGRRFTAPNNIALVAEAARRPMDAQALRELCCRR